jgi:hypothetical protein
VEAYVRGEDLVAAYRRTEGLPFDPQIYWRADRAGLPPGVLGSLSLLVSVQTDSLDTHPRLYVSTQLAATELLPVSAAPATAACLLWRLSDAEFSYAEAMPTTDFCDLTIAGDKEGKLVACRELFGEFLEKGVIRRAQVLSVFLPRERDEELAAECCRALQRRPLPLTT